MYVGETIALFVALSWTVTALFAEVASKRMGSLPFNSVRMALSLLLLTLTLWLTQGVPYPRYADAHTWLWLAASGVVGYVVGDYCLMQGYIYVGSRIGQLFMTLSAPAAAITGRLLIGEALHAQAIVGMAVTLCGIAITILGKSQPGAQPSGTPQPQRLPRRGLLYATVAGICQGVGLVLSKAGLQHYTAAIEATGASMQSAPAGALIGLPLYMSMPFAATMIRASIGLVGFVALLLLWQKNGKAQLLHGLADRKAMWCVVGATIFGPFIGVSASLLATQYTSTGIAQTLFALTPILIIAPSAWLFGQKVSWREVLGAVVSVVGVSLFFI